MPLSTPLCRPALTALSLLAIAAPPHALTAQSTSSATALRTAVTTYRKAHEADILREFSALLELPNLASDSANIRRNAAAVIALLEKRGASARLLESPAGGPPAVYGELRTAGATETILFYAHYDGQPVNVAQWATAPWSPTLRDGPLEGGGKVVPLPTTNGTTGPEWRLYARSAGDDKAPIVAVLAALDAMRDGGIAPSVNLKFYFDGEEEAGNPHTRALLERHAALLKSDGIIFADGPVHQSRQQTVVFGVRGITDVVVTAYGPLRALHSGHYGNWAPNPAVTMARFITALRDENGRILIPGFDKDVRPLSAADRRALATVPTADSALRRELGLAATEASNALLAERIMLPALNIRSIHAGGTGAAANAIPVDASASIDFRLVPDQTPAHVKELVEAYATRLGYTVIHAAPDSALRRSKPRLLRFDWGAEGYPAERTRADTPFGRAVVRAVGEGLGTPIIQVPTMGGSAPTYLFAQILKAPLVLVPIANHDDNQHASNENLRLQNLWDGISVYSGLLARLGHPTPPVP